MRDPDLLQRERPWWLRSLHAAAGTVAVRRAGRVRAVPVPRAAVRTMAAAQVTTAVALLMVLASMTAVFSPVSLAEPAPPPATCGSAALAGPSTAPPGAVTVAAGDNSAVTFSTPGTTYWFAPGTHTIGSGEFNAIAPGDNSAFIGAPGAILSGQWLNRYAFVGTSTGVTIEYLTVEEFTPPVNEGAVDHEASKDWTIEYNTITDNIPGTGVYVGTDSVLDYNCITANGQQGFGTATLNYVNDITGGASNVQVNYNEISYNNVCNIEEYSPFPITPPAQCTGAQVPGCGCTGGGKFWTTLNSQFIGNYVHDNYNAGVWWDTNNAVADIEDNYFANNLAWGVFYEISYNAKIVSNVFIGNGNYIGRYYAPLVLPAIFISNSGSDPRLGAYGNILEISGNQFYDNWDGIQAWQDPDRFCGSPALDYGAGYPCTITGGATARTCGLPVPNSPSGPVPAPAPAGRRTQPRAGGGYGTAAVPLIASPPYYDDCQWKTDNLQVYGNLFTFSPQDIPGCTAAAACGFNLLISGAGIFFPYVGNVIPDNLMFSQGNLYADNVYCGPWNFEAFAQGDNITWPQWTGSPYFQDQGSTLNGPQCGNPVSQPPRARWQVPVTIPYRIGRR